MINIPKKKSTGKKKGGKAKPKGKKKEGKKKEEKDTDEMGSAESRSEDLTGIFGGLADNCLVSDLVKLSMERMRTAPQDIINDLLNPKTITHFIKAGVETYDVMLNIGPSGVLPPDTKLRMYRIEKEVLQGLMAIMDMRLKTLDRRIDDEATRCDPDSITRANSKLKKINVED